MLVLPRSPCTTASSRDISGIGRKRNPEWNPALHFRRAGAADGGGRRESTTARSGEPGQNKLNGPLDEKAAIKDFEKKFKDKTKVRRRL